MPVKKRTETADLVVNPEAEVILSVTIGNAQIGASVARFKGSAEVLAKGDISKLNLGKGASLVGKSLVVTTNILDSNQLTNGIVVTYFIESCSPKAMLFDDEVKVDGDICSFIVTFNFK